MQREPFTPDLDKILAPVAGEAPCGPSMRYDPAFLALRQSRVEDDATLPMREWERPLTKADWRGVARDCIAMLGRSKDLQVAAWLCDAWVRQHQIEGLAAGAELLRGLVERYWDDVHPVIDAGDSDARVAPFVWLNEALPLTLKLHVPLMFLPDQNPNILNLAGWDQIITTPAIKEKKKKNEEAKEARLSREDLSAMADRRNLEWLSDLQEQLKDAQVKWDALGRVLDDRLALAAPSLAKVTDVSRKLERACVSLLDGRSTRQVAPEPAAAVEQVPLEAETRNDQEPSMTRIADASPPAAQQDAGGVVLGPISNRQEAYRMLEAAAAFLQKTEPHSPTPYLIKRAVTWGQMSLADLMQEILREEGDLNRYFSLLGLNSQEK